MYNSTLGLLIDWIGNESSDLILDTVADFCNENSIRLIVFTLGSLSYNTAESNLEKHILPILESNIIDKLIMISPQLVRNNGDTKLEKILNKAPKIPTICIEGKINGYPLVLSRYKKAYLELLNHLWDIHGYRTFAWVGGPKENPVAIERKSIFTEFLKSKGKKLIPELDIDGNFNFSAGCDAGDYLNKCSIKYDVVVAANDLMAFGIKKILGNEIKVVGFDNSNTAQKIGLTTIDSGGAHIIETALKELYKNSALKQDQIIHTFGKAIIRSSCGCTPKKKYELVNTLNEKKELTRYELYYDFINKNDMTDLGTYLNKILPSEKINYWHFLPSSSNYNNFIDIPKIAKTNILIIHSLFKNNIYYGYFIHDLSNKNYQLSDWLRHNISMTFNLWESESNSINTQKLLKKELEKYTRRKKDIEEAIDSLPVIIIELDSSLNIRYANNKFRKLLKQKNIKGVNFLNLININKRTKIKEFFKSLHISENKSTELLLKESIRLIGEISVLKPDSSNNFSNYKFVGMELNPLIEDIIQPEDELLRHINLGKRESQILRLITKGLDSNDIASTLNISNSTVRVQLRNIYIKAGVKNKKELIELLADYSSRTEKSYSLSQVLLSRMFKSK